MSTSPTYSQASSQSSTVSSPKQDALIGYCQRSGMRPPSFQIMSDRRGGRTAWSCAVTVVGREVSAVLWYDGDHINNAREEAAERALQMLGVLPSPQSPQSSMMGQQQLPQQNQQGRQAMQYQPFQQQERAYYG